MTPDGYNYYSFQIQAASTYAIRSGSSYSIQASGSSSQYLCYLNIITTASSIQISVGFTGNVNYSSSSCSLQIVAI